VSHPLVAQLETGDAAARRAACAAIVQDPSAVLLLEPLRDALGDSDPGVRRAAGDALVQLGRQAGEVDALLLGVLRSGRTESRFEAAHALAELAPPSPKLIPALVAALGHERRETAWEAARILVDAGRLHAEVAPIVIGLVRAGPSTAVRCMAVACLRELAPEHPESAKALLEVSRDPEPTLRRAAFTALPSVAPYAAPGEEIGARCRDAAAADPDPAVRTLAERALELIQRDAN
jgi:HEAT repeat protein